MTSLAAVVGREAPSALTTARFVDDPGPGLQDAVGSAGESAGDSEHEPEQADQPRPKDGHDAPTKEAARHSAPTRRAGEVAAKEAATEVRFSGAPKTLSALCGDAP